MLIGYTLYKFSSGRVVAPALNGVAPGCHEVEAWLHISKTAML